VWASLLTVAAIVGSGTWGLGSGVSQAFGGVGYEIWSAAKLDAAAWGVTWLARADRQHGRTGQA